MIRTLPVLLGALMLSHSSYAQVDENFENGITSLINSCWQFNNVYYAQKSTDSNYVIAGNGSIYTNPPVNSTNYRSITSPFLDLTSATISVSFQYKLSSKLKKGATRVIEIGAIDKAGSYTFFDRIVLDEHSSTSAKDYIGDKPVSILPAPGVYQLVVKMGGQQGDGDARLLLDDLKIGAPYHYTAHCNRAPIAVDDRFTGTAGGVFNGPSVLDNDQEPDGEEMTATLVANSPDGDVSLGADGSVTFIPNKDFKGSSTSFTYKVTDNGYMPATSYTATATIEFAQPSSIVLNLVAFNGRANKGKVQLNWEVASNELNDRFEIQKSTNGSDFTTSAIIKATTKTGSEQYSVTESASASSLQYRLKLVSQIGREEYSKIINLSSDESDSEQPLTIFNNPVASKLLFTYTAPAREEIFITILSNSGVAVYSAKETANTGTNLFQMNAVSQLKQGTYILSITSASGKRYSLLFVKI